MGWQVPSDRSLVERALRFLVLKRPLDNSEGG